MAQGRGLTHSSSVHPTLERKPGGPDNWVEKAGGLPGYIDRIARHLHADEGMTVSHAIASAVNTVKRWAAGGGGVSAQTRAKAAAAVAQWTAMKAGTRASSGHQRTDLARTVLPGCMVDLATTVPSVNSGDGPRATFGAKAPAKTPPRTAQGKALPAPAGPGARPSIRTRDDLAKAIKAAGRAGGDKAKVRARLMKRARALDALDLIPSAWKPKSTAELSHARTPFLPLGTVWDLARARANPISSHGFVPNNPVTALKWRKGGWTPPGGSPISAAEIRSRLGVTSNKDAIRALTSDPAAMDRVLGKSGPGTKPVRSLRAGRGRSAGPLPSSPGPAAPPPGGDPNRRQVLKPNTAPTSTRGADRAEVARRAAAVRAAEAPAARTRPADDPAAAANQRQTLKRRRAPSGAIMGEPPGGWTDADRAAPAPARPDVPSRPVRNRPPRRQSPPAAPAAAPSADTPSGRRQIREQQRATGQAWTERAQAQRARDEKPPGPPMTQRRRVVGTALANLVKRQQTMNTEQRRILAGAVEKFKAGDNEGAVEQLHRVPMHKGHAKKLFETARRNIVLGARTPQAPSTPTAREAEIARHDAAVNAEWEKIRAQMPRDYTSLSDFYERALNRPLTPKERQAAARSKQFPTITLEQAKAAVEHIQRSHREREKLQRDLEERARKKAESPEVQAQGRVHETERKRRAARRAKPSTPLAGAGTLTDEEFAALPGPVLRGAGTPDDPRVRYDTSNERGGRWVVEARNRRGQIRRASVLSDTDGPSDEAERQRVSDLEYMNTDRARPRTSRERAVAMAEEFAAIAKKSAAQRRKEQRARTKKAEAAPGDGGLFPAPKPQRPRKDDRGTPEEFAAGTRITVTTPDGPVQAQVWSQSPDGHVFAIDEQRRTWRVSAKGGKGERVDTRKQAEDMAAGRKAAKERAARIRTDRLAKYGTTDVERARKITSRGDQEMTPQERAARAQAKRDQAAAEQPKPKPSLDELREEITAKQRRDIAAKRATDPWRPDDDEAIADMRTAIDAGRYEWADQIAQQRIFSADRIDREKRGVLERLRARAGALRTEQQAGQDAVDSGDPQRVYETGMRSGARAERDGRPAAAIAWLEWMIRHLPAGHPELPNIRSMLNKRRDSASDDPAKDALRRGDVTGSARELITRLNADRSGLGQDPTLRAVAQTLRDNRTLDLEQLADRFSFLAHQSRDPGPLRWLVDALPPDHPRRGVLERLIRILEGGS